MRFVNSLGLGKEPSIEPVRRRLARSPGVRFKLDAEATWPPALWITTRVRDVSIVPRARGIS